MEQLVVLKTGSERSLRKELVRLQQVRHVAGCVTLVDQNLPNRVHDNKTLRLIDAPSQDYWLATRFVGRGITLQQVLVRNVETDSRWGELNLPPVRTALHGYPDQACVPELWRPDERAHSKRWKRIFVELTGILQSLEALPTPVIHCDVKPSNILLDWRAGQEDEVKVTLCDFDSAEVEPTLKKRLPLYRTSHFLPDWFKANPVPLRRAHPACLAATIASVAEGYRSPSGNNEEFVRKAALPRALWRALHGAMHGSAVSTGDLRTALERWNAEADVLSKRTYRYWRWIRAAGTRTIAALAVILGLWGVGEGIQWWRDPCRNKVDCLVGLIESSELSGTNNLLVGTAVVPRGAELVIEAGTRIPGATE